MQSAGMTYKEQLQYLKGMTVRTGSIHEAQALQIRNWPLVIPGVRKAKVSIDTDNQIIYYDCEFQPEAKVGKRVLTVCRNITIWVRSIVWDKTTVVFQRDGKSFHDSRTEQA